MNLIEYRQTTQRNSSVDFFYYIDIVAFIFGCLKKTYMFAERNYWSVSIEPTSCFGCGIDRWLVRGQHARESPIWEQSITRCRRVRTVSEWQADSRTSCRALHVSSGAYTGWRTMLWHASHVLWHIKLWSINFFFFFLQKVFGDRAYVTYPARQHFVTSNMFHIAQAVCTIESLDHVTLVDNHAIFKMIAYVISLRTRCF